MYNEAERKLANTITSNTEMMALLRKVLLPERSAIRNELEKNIASLSDEQYGQVMKALVLAETHVENGLLNLKQIAMKEKTKNSPIAPT